jgi:FKBP-type peptidyl-prolyl cis-trans isomerase FklB
MLVHGPHAPEGRFMKLSAPRGGRMFAPCFLIAALLALTPLAYAQQPPAPASAPAPAPATAPVPASAPAAAKKAPTSPAAAGAQASAAGEKNAVSYSVGVSMGEQLRSSGVTPADLNTERLAQGVRDALSGKAKLTDADRAAITKLAHSAHEAAGEANHRAAAKFLAENGKKPGVITAASGLQYKVLAAGSGESPKASDSVTVNYRGTLLDGTEFDSSYKRGEPATFQVNRVIPGWTEALQLMKPGAKYQLFIPPQLAYDLRSPPPIPSGSMLIFDVELVSFKPAATAAAPAQPAAPSTPAK